VTTFFNKNAVQSISQIHVNAPKRFNAASANGVGTAGQGHGRLYHLGSVAGVFHGFQPGNMTNTGEQNNLNEQLDLMSIWIGIPFAS
jgi:hypothetical protein